MQCVCQWRAPSALVSPTPSPTPKNPSQCWVGGAPTKLRSGCYGGYRSVSRFCARIWFPMFEMCSQLFQFCCLDRSSPPSAAPGAKIEPSQSTENKWEHKSNTTSKHNRNINLNPTRTQSRKTDRDPPEKAGPPSFVGEIRPPTPSPDGNQPSWEHKSGEHTESHQVNFHPGS